MECINLSTTLIMIRGMLRNSGLCATKVKFSDPFRRNRRKTAAAACPTTRSHPPPSGNELIINPGGKAADVGWDFCDNLFAIFQTITSVQKLNNKKRSVMPHGHTVEREKWLKTEVPTCNDRC